MDSTWTSAAELVPARRLTRIDLLFLAWGALWLAVAIAVAIELRGLSELSDTVGRVGRALSATGEAVGSVSDAPLVGGQLGEAGRRIEEAGTSARASARASRDSVDNLTLLLSVAIAVIPSLPLLGIYLPLRLARAREARALAALWRVADPPTVERFLAERALQRLPYRELRRVAPEPWLAPAGSEERRRLAAAELGRLGLRPAADARAAP